MNKFKMTLAAAVVGLAALPMTAKADSTSATASATVAAPITVAKTTDLLFGTIAPTASAGTITMTNAGAISADANTELLGGTTSAASFAVDGEASTAFSATVDASATLAGSGTAAGQSMTVTLTNDVPGSPTLDGSGDATINVGGGLAVGANQVAGPYSGTFNVTVSYN